MLILTCSFMLFVTAAETEMDRCSGGGAWTQIEEADDYYWGGVSKNYSMYRTDPLDATRIDAEQLELDTCPTEAFHENGFFLGIDMVKTLVKRRWVSADESCRHFQAKEFLSTLQDRELHMFGDSVTFQVFKSLACSLNLPELRMQSIVHWAYYQGGTAELDTPYFNYKTCPLGKMHCHILKDEEGFDTGTVYFPTYNATIKFIWIDHYYKGLLWIIKSRQSKDDIALVNFGLHFNDEGAFSENVNVFKSDLMNLTSAVGDDHPHLFFLETAPQHFPTPGASFHGYYWANTADSWCDPEAILDEERQYTHYDWRNIIPRKELVDEDIHIIKIARELYSQHDAHIGSSATELVGAVRNYHLADCTHWTAPSGVFQYISTIIYNSILQHA